MKVNLCIILSLLTLTAQNLLSQDFRFGKVSEEELLQKSHPINSNAEASILYRKTYSNFDYSQEAGFTLVMQVHERIKIYNKEGYDQATIEINQYVGNSKEQQVFNLKAVTYNLEGDKVKSTKLQSRDVFKEDKNKYRKVTTFTMPNINNGSIIEYKYSIRSPFISNIDEFRFQESIPVDRVEMTFRAPEYFNYKNHSKGVIPLKIQTNSKERSIQFRYANTSKVNLSEDRRSSETLKFQENEMSISLSNIAAMQDEPFSGNIDNFRSALKVELASTNFPNTPLEYYATTWEAVATSIYESSNFGNELNHTKYFKDHIDSIIARATSDEDKMIGIYQFVQNKMNWNNVYGVFSEVGVKKAFKNEVGNVADINLMLTAMLRYAGLQSDPVLVSTKQNGIPVFPTRTGFNYVVVGVKMQNKLKLLDGTDKNGAPNILKTSLLNWEGRMIERDGSSVPVDLYPKRPAVHSAFIDLKIGDNLNVEGKVQNRFTGHYAKNERNNFEKLSSEKQLERLDENFEGIDALDVSFKDLKNNSKPLTLEYNFETEDLIDEVGDKIYFRPLVHLAQTTINFKAENREHPIDYGYAWKDKYIININLPEGYEVYSMPENLSLSLPDKLGSYRFFITQSDGKINLNLQNSINVPLVDAGYYEGLKEYLKLIVDKETEKIVLKKI